MGLTKLALSRPIFMFMLMLLAMIMGVISYLSMRKEEQPEVSFGAISVATVYPGAGPDEINTLVSRRIEEAVSSVEGLQEVTSTSQEGFSVVSCRFDVAANMDRALNDVRAKVDAISNQLPQAVEKPTISKFDTTSSPILYMVLRSSKMDNRALRDLADQKLKDRFARVPGVAEVRVSGGEEREIQVRVKKDALLAYGIGIVDVLRAVQAANLNVPSGHMLSGNQEFSVRVLGDYKSAEDVGNTALSIRDQKKMGGRPTVVPLRQLATIEDSSGERREWSRLDRGDSVVMTISKARDGNAIEISAGADDVLKQIKSEFGIEAVKTLDSAKHIKESLFDLNMSLLIGILLVSFIVYLFLHNFRGMLIVVTAIPICLLAAIVALKALGFTINMMSMLALSLAVGVLVDDAIVVLENIYRHLKMGEDPKTAAINGRSEIGLAAIAITMADVVVFVPIATMGGVIGQFFKPMGVAFVCATLLSLLVSFTITPMLAARWYREGEDVEHPQGWFHGGFESLYLRLAEAYRRSLAWALNHRWFVFVGGFVALFASFWFIWGTFMPSLDSAINQPGVIGLTLVMVVGFIAFGFNYWRKVMSSRAWKWTAWLTPFLVGLILAVAPIPKLASMPPPMKFIMGAVLGLLLLGVVGFITNIFRTEFRARFIASTLAFGLVFVVAAVAGFKYAEWKGESVFKFAFMPPSDGGQVNINLVLPPGSTLTETENTIKRVESVVQKHADVKYVLSTVGQRGAGNFSGSDSGTNYGQVVVTLNDKASPIDKAMFWVKHTEKLRDRADSSVAADMLESLGKIPGVEMTVNASAGMGFGAPIQMSFTSDDREALLTTVRTVETKLKAGVIKGVVSPEISAKPGKPEIRAIPDRARLADVGLTSADIANTMRVLYEGDNTSKLRVLGREYDIRVMMDVGDRNNPTLVAQLPLSFVEGKPVFLSQVARLDQGVSLDKVRRRDRSEEITLSANLLPGFAAGSVQREIDQWLEKDKIVPASVHMKPLGQADVQNREGGYLLGALVIALILVYMLLASLYNNLLYPFIIQLAQPMAMVGALAALMIFDKTLNIVGMVGIITLVGLVGKNAILVVDYTNTLRARGRTRLEALLEAGPTRLRPIMMTTLALILGMMPVALALGRGSEFRDTIGITIIGGMILSSLLTLLVIPCSYTIFDDMSQAFSRRRQKPGSTKPERIMETRTVAPTTSVADESAPVGD